jgi:hypothetical protein
MNRLKKAPSSSFRCEKKTSSNCRFFRYRDSSSNDIGLDTDDRRLSSEDEYVAHIESDQDISIDSGEREDHNSAHDGLTLDSDINDFDDDDRWSAYSVDKSDSVCRKFDDLIRRGLISRKAGILYKYLSDVIEIFYDRCHAYDREVVEFFNTIRHLGGRRTVNFFRGLMNIGGQLGKKPRCNPSMHAK